MTKLKRNRMLATQKATRIVINDAKKASSRSSSLSQDSFKSSSGFDKMLAGDDLSVLKLEEYYQEHPLTELYNGQ